MKKTTFFTLFIILLAVFQLSGTPETQINRQNISDNLWVISGIGGNIAVLTSGEGLLLVDSGVPQTGTLLRDQLSQWYGLPVRILINTHYHQDHTGGNPALGKKATLIAHRNCRASMYRSTGEKTSAEIRLPDKTFDDRMKISFGEETLLLLHTGPGHTRGDTVVVFIKNRVIHTGDLFFHNIAPYIDVADGSDTARWIATIQELAGKYPEHRVIPGHGELTDTKHFMEFSRYLQFLRNTVEAGLAADRSLAEILAAASFDDFTHIKEKNTFMTRENNLRWVYQEITERIGDGP